MTCGIVRLSKRKLRSQAGTRVYDGKIGCEVAKKKLKPYDIPTEIRRLARERVGAVPSPKLITPKKQRKKPKHKRPPGEEAG
jgi:hypothetical protein